MRSRARSLNALFAALLVLGTWSTAGKAIAGKMSNAFDFEFTSIDGKPMPLSAYAGKVLLVVNTASFCGFTKQYAALQKLQETYADKGLVVIGVPSNDFGGQEPGSAQNIKQFCEGNFGITFPMTEKYPVTGAGAHPFYRWAVAELGPPAAPAWNFHKYLIARDGHIAKSILSGATPDSKDVMTAIETELARPAS